jgi:hypothetical protein
MGTGHMLLSDTKNIKAKTDNMKPHDMYQQNSNKQQPLILKTGYFNNCFH